MKNKVLFSTLLGGALLTACTADDALDVNKVAEKVNPAAPVFTVSFGDDDLTRATMDDDGKAIKWEMDDKMSLFHGGLEDAQGSWSGLDFFKGDIQVYQRNAIYAADKSNESGKVEYKTAAMVVPGAAIMVYPADLTFTQKWYNPHISIKMDQVGASEDGTVKATRDSAPYVSEVLNLQEGTGDQTAGYGRNYDVVMRRIAGLLKLKLDAVDGADFSKIRYKKVTMEVTNNADSNPFTSEMEIKVGKSRNYSGYNNNTTELGGDNTGHKHWAYTPWIEPTADGKSNKISTTDINNGTKTVFFTLLPHDDADNKVFSKEEADMIKLTNSVDNTKTFDLVKPNFTGLTITVETNYGKVVYTEDNATKRWNAGEGWDMTMTNGLMEFLFAAFHPQEPWTNKDGVVQNVDSRFKGQLMANRGTRTLTIKLADLDMNYLHIENEEDLNDVLSVYDKLVKPTDTKGVVLILDGAKAGKKNPGKFTMTEDTWTALETRFANPNNKVKLALCAKAGEACTAVVLDNGEAEAAEVPALQFVTEAGDESVQQNRVVELVGEWKYTDVTENANKVANATLKALDIDQLTVTKDATIVLQNYIKAKNPVKLFVENGADVTVSGVVTLQENMTNFGKIKIGTTAASTDQLAVDNGVSLWNREAILTSAQLTEDWWNTTTDKGGVIDVYSTLAIVSNSTGKIYNRGVINMESENAIVLITNNQDGATYANVGKQYTPSTLDKNSNGQETCRFGTINLNGGVNTGAVTLTIQGGLNGFVKYNMSTGTNCDLANYCVVDKAGDFPTTNAGEKTYHAGLKYIEIAKNLNAIINAKSYATPLSALIVPSDGKVYIPSDVTLSMETTNAALYVNGTVTHAINFPWTDESRNNYFGDGSKGGVYSAGGK